MIIMLYPGHPAADARTSSSGAHDYVIRGGLLMLRGGCACLPELQTRYSGYNPATTRYSHLPMTHTDISPVSREPT